MTVGMSVSLFVSYRKLYWVDSFYGSVHVMELDGRYKKKLLSDHFKDGNNTYIISRPRAVAVNPKYGYDWILTVSRCYSGKYFSFPCVFFQMVVLD